MRVIVLLLKYIFFSILHTTPLAIVNLKSYKQHWESISCIKQANKVFFRIQSFNFTSSSLISPIFLAPDDLWFPFAEHTARHCGKNKKRGGLMAGEGKEWIEEQGNEGKGALWENTYFAIFPKPTIFPRGWEKRRRERRGLIVRRGSETTHVTR